MLVLITRLRRPERTAAFDKNRRLVKPHSYTIEVKRTTEIVPARRERINLAQRPDKAYSQQTIHQRVVTTDEEWCRHAE